MCLLGVQGGFGVLHRKSTRVRGPPRRPTDRSSLAVQFLQPIGLSGTCGPVLLCHAARGRTATNTIVPSASHCPRARCTSAQTSVRVNLMCPIWRGRMRARTFVPSQVYACAQGHLFCAPCLEQHRSRGTPRARECPTCRVALPDQPIRSLAAGTHAPAHRRTGAPHRHRRTAPAPAHRRTGTPANPHTTPAPARPGPAAPAHYTTGTTRAPARHRHTTDSGAALPFRFRHVCTPRLRRRDLWP